MPNRVNSLLVADYKKTWSETKALVAVGYPGLPVKKVDALRGELAKRGVRIKFVRNILAAIAFKEMGHPDLSPICVGQTAFAWSEDPVSLARFFVEYQKEHPELKVHGALVEATVVPASGIQSLADSPTKQELKSILSGQALSAGRRLSGQFLAAGSKVAGQIKKMADKEDAA